MRVFANAFGGNPEEWFDPSNAPGVRRALRWMIGAALRLSTIFSNRM